MRLSIVKFACLLIMVLVLLTNKPLYAAPLAQESCEVLLSEGEAFEEGTEYGSALESYREAQACYREKGELAGEAQSTSQMGRVYEALGQYEQALEHYNEALTIYQQIEDDLNQLFTLSSIGFIYFQIEQYQQAIFDFEQALTIFRELDLVQPAFEGTLINIIGQCYFSIGQYDEGLSHYSDALTIFRQIGDRPGQILALYGIGDIYLGRGQYDEAFSNYQEGLTISQEIGDRDREGTAHKNLAQVYLAWGQYDKALEHLQQALTIWDEDESGWKVAILDLIGRVYANQGEYDQALDYYQQALTISREIPHRSSEANALNNIGQVYFNRGEYQTALDNFEQAKEIFKQIDNPAREASTLNNIGQIYDNWSEYQKALEFYEQAKEIFKQIGDRAGEATTLNNIGQVYDNWGEYQKALDFYQQSLEIDQEIGVRAGQATTLNNIGLVYEHWGEYQKALDFYEQAKEIFKQIGGPVEYAITLNNIGLLYSNWGEYQKALDFYQQSLKIKQEIGNRAGEAITLNNIGTLHLNLGQHQAARQDFEQALQIQQEIGKRSGEASTLNNIGLMYNDLAEYQKALDYYQQALEIQQEIGVRAGEATTLNNMGTVYQDLGQLDSVLDFYEQALQIAQEIGLRDLVGTSLHNIGSLYDDLGDYEKTLEFYQQALEIDQEIGARARQTRTLANIGRVYFERQEYETALDYYQQALEIAQGIGDRASEGLTLKNIGQVYKVLGQYERAREDLQRALEISQEVGDRITQSKALHQLGATYAALGEMERAVTHYEEAIALIEQVRDEITVDEFKSGFSFEYVELYAELIDLLVELGRDEDAFNYVQRAKARSFLDQLGNGPLDIRAGATTDLLAQEQQLRLQIAARREQLVKLAKQKDDNSTSQEVKEQLSALEEQYEALLVEMKAASPEAASLVSVDVASLEEVQDLLSPNTTLVEYFISDQQTLIFVISADSFELVVSDVSRQEVGSQVSRLRSALNPDLLANKPESAAEDTAKESQPLYSWFITPIADSLEGQLLIAPHSVLHYLPFSALTNGQDYLLDQVSLVTLPSASTLRFIKDKIKPESGQLLALGNPTTALPSLPAAAKEVERIARLYDAGDADTLIGEQATEEAIWDKAGQANVIHLAAHGEYNRVNPSFSTLHLAAGGEHDGRLEVHEIYGLDLTQATNLVVLSACETQLPAASDLDNKTISDGDEIVALNRALLYAGTPQVIASLWNVDDQATALLMERFYNHLREGATGAQALRQAQQELRADEQYSHPYYWAAFVLTGDGGDVPNISSDVLNISSIVPSLEYGPWLLLFGTLTLLIVALVGWRWKRKGSRATTTGAQSPPIGVNESASATKTLVLVDSPRARPKNISFLQKPFLIFATSRKFWPLMLAVIVLQLVILAAFVWYKRAPATPKSAPRLGFILDVTSQVDVKHGEGLKKAEIGLELYQNDVVIAYAEGGAVISLSCPQETFVLTVEALQNLQLDCNDVQNVIAELKPEIDTSEEGSVVVLPVQRSSRQREGQTPILLSPRNSVITDTQPTFHWQAVPGASSYRLSLNIPDGENWEVETTETTLPYAAHTDKAPLPAGSTNIFVKLATLDNPTEAEETFVDVMDEAALADLSEAETNIRQLPVDESAKAYLLAQLYGQREMKAAAIAQLEQITATENQATISADLWQQLGDLYFEIGLHAQAEETYQQALSSAEANDNQQAQAAAYFGLARTAVVFGENEQALDYLEQAETLYRQAGDNALAEQVAELKQQIEK